MLIWKAMENSIMNIQDVKLYDAVRIKPNKCLYDYERRLIYAVTHIDLKTKRVHISSLNHKDYFISSFPDTIGIDVSDIEKVANTHSDPLYDYVRYNEQFAQK